MSGISGKAQVYLKAKDRLELKTSKLILISWDTSLYFSGQTTYVKNLSQGQKVK